MMRLGGGGSLMAIEVPGLAAALSASMRRPTFAETAQRGSSN
jgi:hypothetical protein